MSITIARESVLRDLDLFWKSCIVGAVGFLDFHVHIHTRTRRCKMKTIRIFVTAIATAALLA
ncbi:MAG: hypothetical protein AAB756_01260, partial [Patescibacteria group bacterium]